MKKLEEELANKDKAIEFQQRRDNAAVRKEEKMKK